jgi:lysozyme
VSLNQVDGKHPAMAYTATFVSTLDRLEDRLEEHEGLRLTVYDDATGKPIVKGSVVQGHPTIGIGRNLAGKGITKIEARDMLSRDIEECWVAVLLEFPWAKHMNDARFSVLVELVFQMGLAGVKKFVTTLKLMEDGAYAAAAEQMLRSLWAKQTPKRATRLAEIMRTGDWG